MTNNNLAPFRADHVGSFLRPPELLQMRTKWKAGEVSDEDLRNLEDTCIQSVVRMQEEAGMQTVTDGEFRRESFHHDFSIKFMAFNLLASQLRVMMKRINQK